MLLRNSISTTKKFFQKTIKSFKSLFSGSSYERLPKSSPYYQYPYSSSIPEMNNKDLDKFYTDFANRWDKEEEKNKSKKKTTVTPPSSPPKQSLNNGRYCPMQRKENLKRSKVKRSNYEEERSRREQERRSLIVAEKLKEIEMMDISNVEHVLDIEEILHYYSRLTCPAYLDIVDKFFLDIYSELFGTVPVSTPSSSVNSRPNIVSSLRS